MKRATLAGLTLTFVALLAACTTEDKAPTLATAAPDVVDLSATEFAFQSPDTVRAGWITFRMANLGQEIHYGHIVRLDTGKTVQELVDAYAEAIRTSGPRPQWVTRFGGPGGTAPGDTSSVTQYLEPGSYVWICPIEDNAGNPHFGKGEVKSFVVLEGGAVASERGGAPEAGVVVHLMDFSFALGDSLRAGQHTIRVENDGVEPHDLAILKLASGKTMDDLQGLLNPERARRAGQTGEPPPMESLVTLVGGVAAMRSKMEAFFDADITPGDYVFVCMATAPDGRSHIEHGMIQQFTVR